MQCKYIKWVVAMTGERERDNAKSTEQQHVVVWQVKRWSIHLWFSVHIFIFIEFDNECDELLVVHATFHIEIATIHCYFSFLFLFVVWNFIGCAIVGTNANACNGLIIRLNSASKKINFDKCKKQQKWQQLKQPIKFKSDESTWHWSGCWNTNTWIFCAIVTKVRNT